jgi:polysaccharide pyruvyl transferase WcaK-like protein
MVVGGVEYLERKGFKVLSLISYVPSVKNVYPVQDKIYDSFEMRDFFIYTSPLKAIRKIIEFAVYASHYESFYCFGADVMDGYYSDYATVKKIKLTEIAARIGLKSTIVGFSFNNSPTKASIACLNSLPKAVTLCARDPISHSRLNKFLSRSTLLTAMELFY